MAVLQRSHPARLAKRRRAGHISMVLTLLALTALVACVGSLWRHSPILGQYGAALLGFTQSPAQVFPQTPQSMNLLVIGRRDASRALLMVAHFDFDKKTFVLLPLPRGVGAAGPQETEQAVQQTYGIPCSHYLTLQTTGFGHAIDALGGVNLDVTRPLNYDDDWRHLHIHLRPGYQHLNGTEALDFLRFPRPAGSRERLQRQRTLLSALRAKLRQPQTLPHLPALLADLHQYAHTNLTTEQQIVLARFLHDTPRQQITFTAAPSRVCAMSKSWS